MNEVTELKLINLSVGYAVERPIITGINERLLSKKLIALVGDNGSGKTTLLRTLISEIPPLSGEIIINNRNLDDLTPLDKSTLISVVFTGRNSTMGLTVDTVVNLGRHPYSGFFTTLSEEDKKRIKFMVSLMGISQLMNKKMEEISDGEYQKVMITRALVQDTPVILLDEPLAFLDYNSKIDLLNTLKKLVEKTEKLIVFSSHDLNLLPQVVHEILVINHSKMELVSKGIRNYLAKNFGVSS